GLLRWNNSLQRIPKKFWHPWSALLKGREARPHTGKCPQHQAGSGWRGAQEKGPKPPRDSQLRRQDVTALVVEGAGARGPTAAQQSVGSLSARPASSSRTSDWSRPSSPSTPRGAERHDGKLPGKSRGFMLTGRA